VAFIDYIPEVDIPEEHRVNDNDNILRIHGIHSAVTKMHYDLYKELMWKNSPLSRIQREMIAVTVSKENDCHY